MTELDLAPLEQRLDYTFQKRELLLQALTHPSLAHDMKLARGDNQRLEFLGDAVLQMTLTLHLFHAYPKHQEGRLTKMRAAAVNKKALNEVARKLELDQFILLSRGESKNEGKTKPSNLADAMEAIIGAILLDAGYEFTQEWVQRIFDPVLTELGASEEVFNPKGELQEFLQGQGKATPSYQLVDESGPDHDKSYTIRVLSEGQEIGAGSGSSKKAAESSAALNALKNVA
ncbi:MAG: ribonuclease III [Verrucomicrobiota bacterium]